MKLVALIKLNANKLRVTLALICIVLGGLISSNDLEILRRLNFELLNWLPASSWSVSMTGVFKQLVNVAPFILCAAGYRWLIGAYFNHRPKIKPARPDNELVRGVAQSRPTLEKIAAFDRYLSWVGTVSREGRSARLRRYIRLTKKMRICETSKDHKAKVFLTSPGAIELRPPKRAASLQHEFLHIYQEVCYGALTREYEGRLGFFFVGRVELEATFPTEKWLFLLYGIMFAGVPALFLGFAWHALI